jgi:Amt family ammonium transporter
VRGVDLDCREWVLKGKPSMLGAASGAVAGLVAITPAAGNVGIQGCVRDRARGRVVCFWGCTGLKKIIGADDALDVFGVHALGGIFGALMTGIFNVLKLGGPGYREWIGLTQAYGGIGASSGSSSRLSRSWSSGRRSLRLSPS